ncbi:hypothetical protein GUITHDRAFT_70869 [Guillardia theta CCMP2712]|uniref:Protein kinase domain-containing protein n=1 Tax=Guillardia theta (strain CCMP2712) TaxID=905079 RepID=L1JDG7_GUITC|nr:hypothetical protein GUITHDRAFT_70869 [Guillardia theta CCMP2712]EKX46159.1 hypothetical protein GUITHDRAFT_70869 [Guillardia theta CCMP2712]|eukprot:XP_005833139.1 hypothetical protein GUITHDRAFT_70869 [Guillardia theta CCMP2712]
MSTQSTNNLWLVFYHEGFSLRSFLYEVLSKCDSIRYTVSRMYEESERSASLTGGRRWKDLRTSRRGEETLRELMRQLLEGIADCHRRNVTHRDLKPENLILHTLSQGEQADSSSPLLKLADFGSAIDTYALRHLYGKEGPSILDETLDYAPPEVLFGDGVPMSLMRPASYDMWSVGVIFLEIVLGSSKVFQVDARTRAIIDQKLRTSSAAVRQQAYLFRAMIVYCIYPPMPSAKSHSQQSRSALVPSKCSDEHMHELLRSRDPLLLGLPNIWAVKLVRRLLAWNAESRITAERALQHAYFTTDGTGFTCASVGRGKDTSSAWEFEDEAFENCYG